MWLLAGWWYLFPKNFRMKLGEGKPMTRKFAYQETLEITLNVLSEIADMIISALTLLASDVFKRSVVSGQEGRDNTFHFLILSKICRYYQHW